MTRTTPLRRTILQFSQILLTLARTFMTTPKSTQNIVSKAIKKRDDGAAVSRIGGYSRL
jgi:hypothetical protein